MIRKRVSSLCVLGALLLLISGGAAGQAVVVNLATPYAEDFENGAAGWATPGSLWELGAPAQNSLASAHSGANAWMTDLDANYLNNQNEVVLSPVFDFSSAERDPVFRVAVNYRTERVWDGAHIQVNRGNGWERLGHGWYDTNYVVALDGRGWSDSSGGWRVLSTAVRNVLGNASVQFRFRFGSDSSQTREGVAFDDVSIRVPAYQTNQVQASLVIDGVESDGFAPAVVRSASGTMAMVQFASSLPGNPHDVYVNPNPVVPVGSAGASVLLGNQALNVDPSASVLLWGGFVPMVDQTIPVTAPSGEFTFSAQMLVLDPGVPGLFRASQAAQWSSVPTVHVSPNGSASNPGTASAPLDSITQAIALAQQTPGASVFVAVGSYTETLTLADGVNLFGGRDPQTWAPMPGSRSTVSVGATGLVGTGITSVTRVEAFEFAAANAGAGEFHSIAARLSNCGSELSFTNCRFVAGYGVHGTFGQSGQVGPSCPGGAGGVNGQAGQAGTTCGGAGGAGGLGTASPQSGGFVHAGSPGGHGSSGAHGAAAVAGGAISAGTWVPNESGDGTDGTAGGGGGGGGGAAGPFTAPIGGNDGGAGGGAGLGGGRGGFGGSSFALLLDTSSVVLTDCEFVAGGAGSGGAGGGGGFGGLGLSGAFGIGAEGGLGGNGGHGGGGAGGAGGWSYCIMRNPASNPTLTNPAFTLGSAGSGGIGGALGNGSSSAPSGPDGSFGDMN